MEPDTKRPINYLTLFLEFISIFTGVLLAFAVSEWQESQNKAEAAKYSLNSVYYEVRSNLEAVKQLHQNNLDYIAYAEQTSRQGSSSGSLEEKKFVPGIQLLDTSWQIAQSKELANYIDYQALSSLYEVYSLLAVYKASGQKLIESSLTLTAFITALGKEEEEINFEKNYLDYLKMMVDFEKQLIMKFENAELQLSKQLASS
ncbi:MAG: hypothetical protein OQK04_02360 [Kangiellaceae bacterium]|nr:hypothetical protein [Kangiellaceae bacterium]MCW8997546.1 hypothetical protein [Kangiellaceae bacterium]